MTFLNDDPDVDIVIGNNVLKVFIDLRGKGLKNENVMIKADKEEIYIFDKESNNVIKIIKLPEIVDPSSFSLSEKFGTYIITLKKIKENKSL